MTNSMVAHTDASSSIIDTSSEMLICTTDQMTTFIKCISGPQNILEQDDSIMDTRNSLTALDHPLESRHTDKHTTIILMDDFERDPHGPTQVSRKVKMVINKWGPVEPINPERFFLKMLLSRGYPTKMIPALTSPNRR